MSYNLEYCVLELLDCLERVERLQYLLSIAIEQFDELENQERYQRVEVLLERYVGAAEPCFDEIGVLRRNILKDLSDSSGLLSPGMVGLVNE